MSSFDIDMYHISYQKFPVCDVNTCCACCLHVSMLFRHHNTIAVLKSYSFLLLQVLVQQEVQQGKYAAQTVQCCIVTVVVRRYSHDTSALCRLKVNDG